MNKKYSPNWSSREVAVLLAFIAPIALELQENSPEIAAKWEKGATLDSLAKEYNVTSMLEGCNNPERVAQSVVRFSLVGMRGGNKVEGFPGLVSQELYKAVSLARSRENITNYNNSLEGQIGFANLSEEDLRALSRDAATRRLDYRGKPRALIDSKEAEFAYNLSLDEAYQSSRGVCWKRVVAEVNEKFHSGEAVRSVKAVRNMVYKAKSSQPVEYR